MIIMKRPATRILATAFIALLLPLLDGCSGHQDLNDSFVLETETFRLTLGKDAIAKSLVIKSNNEEMLVKDSDIPLFTVTQERPFNNEIKLQHRMERGLPYGLTQPLMKQWSRSMKEQAI